MFESSPVGIIESDERGRVTNWNPHAETIFGWSKAEMMGRSLTATLIPQRQRTQAQQGLQHFVTTRETPVKGQLLDLTGLHRDGHEFPIELAVSPAMRAEPVTTVVAYVRDLTLARRAERLETLRVEVTEIAAEAAGMEDMASRVVAAVREAFGWEVGEFWAVDPSRNRLRMVTASPANSRPMKAFVNAARQLEPGRGEGLPGRAWELASVVEQRDFGAAPLDQRGGQALAAGLVVGVGFPLLNGENVRGVMTFYSTSAEAFSDDLRRVMDSICTQIGQFLERDESDHRIRAVLEHVADGIVTLNVDGTIESFNRSAQRLLGYSISETVGQNIHMLIEEAGHEEFVDYIGNLLRPGKNALVSGAHETVGRRKDGTSFPMEFLATDMRIGGRRLFIATLRDITERKAQSDALEYRAFHDGLTQIPNRALLRDRLDRELLAATREHRSCGLLILDMDKFKDVNDTLGHDAGDLLLKEFASRVRGALRDVDTFARLGGDEFAILPVGTGDLDGIVSTAMRVLEALKEPFVISGTRLRAGASIGLALFPEHADDSDALLRRADVAMYVAKETRSGYAVYSPEHEASAGRRMILLADLGEAIRAGKLVMYYQPRVDISSKRTIGVEALVRWATPAHGLLLPIDFIPAAEHSDLIGPLTQWVINETLAQIRAWELEGITLDLSINLSAANLLDDQLPIVVGEMLERWSIPASRVTLEVTETTVLSEGGYATLERLREMGIGLSMDDFGTGYASLTYLRRLPLTELKLDRSFVGSMATDADDAAIVQPAIDLGHRMGLRVVAEGVENQATWDKLATFKCDVAQGYFMAHPMPAHELGGWLRETVWRLEGADTA
jgi:diguanylate cyclase (GGDEF)-like protein/PAS domain S-box-containing protein